MFEVAHGVAPKFRCQFLGLLGTLYFAVEYLLAIDAYSNLLVQVYELV